MSAIHSPDVEEPVRRPERAPREDRPAICPPNLRIAVVGGGISGLTLAYGLLRRADVTVFESAPHAGGHAVTVREHGYLVESGASAFHERHAGLRRLATQLGLSDDLVPALPASSRRYVLRNGRLHLVPDSVRSILVTGALSPMGKLRLLLEPLITRRRNVREETVDEFARSWMRLSPAASLPEKVDCFRPARLSLNLPEANETTLIH